MVMRAHRVRTEIATVPSQQAGRAITAAWLCCCCTSPLRLIPCPSYMRRMAKYMIAREFEHYHGEAINPKHLSTWERWGT